MQYDEPNHGERPTPESAIEDELLESADLLALGEQLREDSRRLAAAYPTRGDVAREFADTRGRSPRRLAIALAASIAAVGLTLWGATAWQSVPVGHGPVVDRGPAVVVADATPTESSLGASESDVMIVPVVSFQEIEVLTVPEREAVFDLLEGDASEVSYLSI